MYENPYYKKRDIKLSAIIAPSLQDVHTIIVISNLRPLRPMKSFYFTKDLMVTQNKILWESYIYLL